MISGIKIEGKREGLRTFSRAPRVVQVPRKSQRFKGVTASSQLVQEECSHEGEAEVHFDERGQRREERGGMDRKRGGKRMGGGI